jgi:HEAT repeat protein
MRMMRNSFFLCGLAVDNFPQRRKERKARKVILLAVIAFACISTLAQTNFDDLKNKVVNGSVEEKRNALFVLRNIGSSDASRVAAGALNDKNELVRATALGCVIFLPRDESSKLALPLLNDREELVRVEAAFALGEIGDSSTLHSLIQALQKDSSSRVRSAAASALGKIGDASAVDSLAALLKRKPVEDEEHLRRVAARSIGQIAQISRTLNRRVDTPHSFLPDKYKDQPSTAEPATTPFPAFRSALSILVSVLVDSKEVNDVRREAAFALGAIGDTSARPVLTEHLDAADNYLAEICKEALLKMPETK